MEARRRYQEALLKQCPGVNDVTRMVDSACNPLPPPQRPDFGGCDCCEFWKAPGQWNADVVRVDLVNPDHFDFDRHRYQMYAKPANHSCHPNVRQSMSSSHADRPYIPPTTDVRALQQNMYIPIVPSQPAGETEVTFPMTPGTMGHPDVTSACCVPVIPSQPGYENLTSGIMPGPCPQLDGHKRFLAGSARGQCPSMQRARTSGSGCPRQTVSEHQAWPCPPQFVAPPSNVPGSGCLGLPDTFPMTDDQARMGYDLPQRPPVLHPPHYTGEGGSQYSEQLINAQQQCVNASSVRHADIESRRSSRAVYETPQQRYQRLTSMYGSFGSYLIARNRPKRFLTGQGSCLKQQGNGFQWDCPKTSNNLCYVIEKNPRC